MKCIAGILTGKLTILIVADIILYRFRYIEFLNDMKPKINFKTGFFFGKVLGIALLAPEMSNILYK